MSSVQEVWSYDHGSQVYTDALAISGDGSFIVIGTETEVVNP